MVTVTALEWLIAPDVPVTIKLTCVGVGVMELLLEPPPHPMAKSETRRIKPIRLIHRMLLRVSDFFLPAARSVPNTPKPGRRVIMALIT